jgi:Asp/Glu/hydantoin racemase
MKPVLIVNPNGSQKTTQDMVGITSRYLPNVMGWTNRKGPKMIIDQEQLYEAANQISEVVFPDVSALIVAAFGDPGAKRLARRMDIPVIGIAAAAAREAALSRVSFAVVTTTPKLTSSIDKMMRAEGGDAYLGCYTTEDDPLVLASNSDKLDYALITSCETAKKAGAKRVIVGGGPLGQAAIRISSQVKVPLIQPLVAACSEVSAIIEHQLPHVQDVGQ